MLTSPGLSKTSQATTATLKVNQNNGYGNLAKGVRPIYWDKGALFALDQRILPRKITYRRLDTTTAVAEAIRKMILRGAPLIGCAAAYGYALAAKSPARNPKDSWKRLCRGAQKLLASRPTAVNLFYAIDRMEKKAENLLAQGQLKLYEPLCAEADAIFREDLAANLHMARMGASLLKPKSTVITYCNAGALATSGVGTALGVIRWAWRTGKILQVYACETRPYLQGSRLTLWELMQERIPCALITDNMAAHILATETVDAIIVGSDRIAANGDVANKIGTYGLALAAHYHRIPFYVVAPSTTVDLDISEGHKIPIEERSPKEVLELRGRSIAPSGAKARHPAFDVTPRHLVSAIVTEKGIVQPVNAKRLRQTLLTPHPSLTSRK